VFRTATAALVTTRMTTRCRGVDLVTTVDISARRGGRRAYLGIRNARRSDYYGKEVAHSHRRGARLSEGGPTTNTTVHHLTEIEKRP